MARTDELPDDRAAHAAGSAEDEDSHACAEYLPTLPSDIAPGPTNL